MVSRILISIALLCSSVAFSQEESTLKFNQVLLVELTEEGIVVPEGKVWKVVSAISNLPGDFGYANQHSYFIINDQITSISRHTYHMAAGPTTSGLQNPIFPIWLPPGVNITSGERVSALSIIEFNTN